ncbi:MULTISPECIES: LPS translocon maturation chaperone LptM [Moraxella]|uniref:Lipoprotein n=1 Tax=Moraxella nasicaprae TaxID=2904122 RepID=A0ABY6F5U2_9GAMM|nr:MULTISPECIES: lipoprotein [Moraxella]MDO4893999.1 lipoprotein [Moraxella sp.]UXZ05461.1 lipoprotein [Moraxella nasicaprae]
MKLLPIALIALLCLTACGQKGALYLPNQSTNISQQ